MKVGIGYAFYGSNQAHFDYAKETLDSIKSAEHELMFCGVINYSARGEYDAYLRGKGMVINNPENNVSMAWNRSIRELLSAGCQYVIVPNLDLVFKSNLVDKLVGFAETHKEYILWTALPWGELESIEQATEVENAPETPHFSCFMVDHRLFDEVGEFDENFRPAYNEDIDMHWRIFLANQKAVGYEGARFYHHGSRTIKSDPALLERNHVTHDLNNKYFVRKWGFKPATGNDPFNLEKMYSTPFNRGW